jgi:putative redox protein
MQVTVQHVDGMRFLATEGSHAVVVDAAPEHGGGGTAMSAPQLFVAALGACILEFVVNSCRLREVPIERLSVTVECEEVLGPRRVGALSAAITLDPEPPEEVKRRVVGVARHATLTNTLARPPEVDIHFATQAREEQ